MSAAGGRTAVVLPYYQRERGLLARALRSILAQQGAGEVLALVVDDASPVPAREELAGLTPEQRERVQLVEQTNTGPGGARNRGLAMLPEDVTRVAYLDSDDWWSEDHLARAAAAFAAGHDLYLSNWMPLEAERDAYTHYQKLVLSEHPPLAGLEGLHAFAGDFFRQELTRPIGRLSTMVFLRERYGDLRFESGLKTAFEDRLYRLELARRSPRIAFSTRVECYSGHGVNLYSGKPWGTPAHLEIVRDELAAMAIVRNRFALSPQERAFVEDLSRHSRRAGLSTLLHLWRHGKALALAPLGRILLADPLFLLRAPLALRGRR